MSKRSEDEHMSFMREDERNEGEHMSFMCEDELTMRLFVFHV